jgi:DNA transposition AAA+ family ATPase
MIQFNPKFVMTRNVRGFEVMMDGLEAAAGEGRFGMVSSQSGLGKTRTAQWWHANNPSVYLPTKKVWETSETDFLFDLGRELGLWGGASTVRRKGRMFGDILDSLIGNPMPVFIDEVERLPQSFLEILRDLTNLSTAPVVLIGEEELMPHMQRNRRVWTRTYRQLQFQSIGPSDVMIYAAETCGLKLSPACADIIQKAKTRDIIDGNFRLVKRSLLSLCQICNAKGTTDVSEEMARIAVEQGLSGA